MGWGGVRGLVPRSDDQLSARPRLRRGPLLDQAVRLAHGRSIYQLPGADPPWTVSNYPPLYPALDAGLAAIFGPASWYGRLIAVVSVAGSAVLVGAIVQRLTADRFAALVSGLLVPASAYVGHWAALARIEPFELTQLSRAGLWDQTPLVSSIDQQRYAVILVYTITDYPLEKDRWSAEMLAAIDRAYVAGPRIGTESGGSVIFTPRR